MWRYAIFWLSATHCAQTDGFRHLRGREGEGKRGETHRGGVGAARRDTPCALRLPPIPSDP
jgi:hypothetical protein